MRIMPQFTMPGAAGQVLTGAPTAYGEAQMPLAIADAGDRDRLPPAIALPLIVGLSLLGWLAVWQLVAFVAWGLR